MYEIGWDGEVGSPRIRIRIRGGRVELALKVGYGQPSSRSGSHANSGKQNHPPTYLHTYTSRVRELVEVEVERLSRRGQQNHDPIKKMQHPYPNPPASYLVIIYYRIKYQTTKSMLFFGQLFSAERGISKR